MKKNGLPRLVALFLFFVMVFAGYRAGEAKSMKSQAGINQEQEQPKDVNALIKQGQDTFRFDTFGDEAFWGDTLKLHQAIEGQSMGGVGAGLSPNAALDLGLKVDVDALPSDLVVLIGQGKVDLNDPRNTLALLKLNAVLGVIGIFNTDGTLKSVGITCALCHSTVDNSFDKGIGHRLDGWANRDLKAGNVIALAPDLSAFVNLLKLAPGNAAITQSDVRQVLRSWGPGKFDVEMMLDGKTSRPDGNPAATMIPNNFGLAGFNQHTWTGDWGTIPYWNALVAVVDMGGIGTFFDPRLDDPARFPNIAPRFPIAVAAKLGHKKVDPDSDRVTKELPGLHIFQLSLLSPKPRPGVDFNEAAADRGNELFSGKAKCGNCHVKPIWTDPGWNEHTPAEVGVDSFQADRSPGRTYKTMNLAGIFIRERGIAMRAENKGRFYHDGRFATLLDVVNHYDTVLNLNLSDAEKSDLVEFLKSL